MGLTQLAARIFRENPHRPSPCAAAAPPRCAYRAGELGVAETRPARGDMCPQLLPSSPVPPPQQWLASGESRCFAPVILSALVRCFCNNASGESRFAPVILSALVRCFCNNACHEKCRSSCAGPAPDQGPGAAVCRPGTGAAPGAAVNIY